MFAILASGGWNVLYKLVNAIIPVSIVVVLPVLVVWLVLRSRQHEVDRKTEIMMKALENGVELNPDYFAETKRPKSAKARLMGYLTTAMVTGVIGLVTLMVEAIVFTLTDFWKNPNNQDVIFALMILSGVVLAIGTAFFIVYLTGKKTYAKELAELEH